MNRESQEPFPSMNKTESNQGSVVMFMARLQNCPGELLGIGVSTAVSLCMSCHCVEGRSFFSLVHRSSDQEDLYSRSYP